MLASASAVARAGDRDVASRARSTRRRREGRGIARSGGRDSVVNAKFGLPNPDGSFEVIKVPKR